MYCPKCAAQNHDQTNFCRSCGAELKTVALAMNGHLALPTDVSNTEKKKTELTQQWLKLQTDGIKSAVQGMLFIIPSALMGLGLWLFINKMEWIIPWLIICGWFASWGMIPLGRGISNLIQARLLRRSIDLLAAALTSPVAHGVGETRRTPETARIPEASIPSSVIEQTTRPLAQHVDRKRSDTK